MRIKSWLMAVLIGTGYPAALALAQGEGEEGNGTGWMELVKGYRDELTGAELRQIDAETTPEGGQRITVAIPKKLIKSDALEEIRVVGRRPEKPEPLIDYTYEWVDDYDNDYYGLIIHIGESGQIPFRIYLDSRSAFVQ